VTSSRHAALIGAIFALGHLSIAQGASATYKTLYNFTYAGDGAFPYITLAIGQHGSLYGATQASPAVCGGSSACGIVFELKPPAVRGGAWTEATIYAFTNPAVAGLFANALAIGANGQIYGTANNASPSANGVVFRLTPPSSPGGAWTESTLYSFQGSPDGASPNGVVIGKNGALYGTTSYGGPSLAGTVFKLAPPASPGGDWIETVLYAFAGVPDGANPASGVIIGLNGVLYGTTHFGGTGGCQGFSGVTGCGAVFELKPPAVPSGPWTESVIRSLVYGVDGGFPNAGVVQGANGAVYAISPVGGQDFLGVPFELTPPSSPGDPWTETVLYNFHGQNSPSKVFATPVLGSNGALYNTSFDGGAAKLGVVFSLKPPSQPATAWTEIPLYSFTADSGFHPSAGLSLGANGALYGVTGQGGTSTACYQGCGTVFQLVP